jgi:hypothetical protein
MAPVGTAFARFRLPNINRHVVAAQIGPERKLRPDGLVPVLAE